MIKNEMLTGEQLIELTGIPPAILKNYITLGILPNPGKSTSEELAPGDDTGTFFNERATKIGYFPNEALARIEEVQRMKKQGMSISAIAEQFQHKSLHETPGTVSADENVKPKPNTKPKPNANTAEGQTTNPMPPLHLDLTIDDIKSPAYMVNNNFELVWWNNESLHKIFGLPKKLPSKIESRNLLSLLMESDLIKNMENWQDLISIHFSVSKKRLSRESLVKLYSSLRTEDIMALEKLYESVDVAAQAPVVHFPISLRGREGETRSYNLYAVFFREGTLFVYSPVDFNNESLVELLSRRNQVIHDLMKRRQPFLTHVAVMVADLQDSVRICAELPAEEYFALINHIWQSCEPIFRKYYATHGKHVGDGMVYYFFPQPDCNYVLNALQCALEIKDIMHDISREWQTRKGLTYDLCLNMGLNEGQEWFGTYYTGNHLEFTVLGDTINHAGRISDFARSGAIWTTKNMLSQISPEEQQQVRFGIRRQTEQNGGMFIHDIYTRISNLVDINAGQNLKFQDIAMLPITEIVGINLDKDQPPAR